ncbi:MAG: LamG domain-containing protein [bacterium]|nr:LamG domain-containing protein [bacterium]
MMRHIQHTRFWCMTGWMIGLGLLLFTSPARGQELPEPLSVWDGTANGGQVIDSMGHYEGLNASTGGDRSKPFTYTGNKSGGVAVVFEPNLPLPITVIAEGVNFSNACAAPGWDVLWLASEFPKKLFKKSNRNDFFKHVVLKASSQRPTQHALDSGKVAFSLDPAHIGYDGDGFRFRLGVDNADDALTPFICETLENVAVRNIESYEASNDTYPITLSRGKMRTFISTYSALCQDRAYADQITTMEIPYFEVSITENNNMYRHYLKAVEPKYQLFMNPERWYGSETIIQPQGKNDVALVVDRHEIVLYVDGQLDRVVTLNPEQPPLPDMRLLFIGGVMEDPTGTHNSCHFPYRDATVQLDQVQLYDRALGPDEIARIYSREK